MYTIILASSNQWSGCQCHLKNFSWHAMSYIKAIECIWEIAMTLQNGIISRGLCNQKKDQWLLRISHIILRLIIIAVPLSMAFQTKAFSSGTILSFEENVDRLGNDYLDMELDTPDPSLCRNECALDANCKAFTYVKPSIQGPKAKCYLKSPAPPPAENNCCVSGVRTGVLLTTEIGSDRPGSDYSGLDVHDIGECRAKCGLDPACKAYTFVNPGVQGPNARCYLKNSVPSLHRNDCCVSGIKLEAGQLPSGSYQQTCNNMQVNDSSLNASCRRQDGVWQSTTLANFDRCIGDIANLNGMLRCNKGDSPPAGSYQRTCRDIWIEETILHASCKRRNGDWLTSSLDTKDCRGEIYNLDGYLSCFLGSTMPPPGSYLQTCRDVSLVEGVLRASCKKLDGRWQVSQLAALNECKSQIRNIDGYLTCDRGTSSAPAGSYLKTCHDVQVIDTSMTARCKRKNGTWISARLDGFDQCVGDIANNDGVLKCNKGQEVSKTCSGSAANSSYKAFTFGIKDNLHCAKTTYRVYANSLDEATQCVERSYPDALIVKPPVTLNYYPFSMTSFLGCYTGAAPAFSSEDAKLCAQSMCENCQIVMGGSCP